MLRYLNEHETTWAARLMELDTARIKTIDGNFGRPVVLYGPEATIDYTPQEALALLNWLQEIRPRLEEAARHEQEGKAHYERSASS